MKWRLLFFLLLLGQISASGQDLTDMTGLRIYASPSVEGMGRSRGIVIRYEMMPDFRISSVSPNPAIGEGLAEVKRNNRLDLRLFVPLINRPSLKLVTGFKSFSEEFNFRISDPLEYPLYVNLDARKLRTLGMQVVLLHSIDEQNYLALRLRGDLNGDYTSLRGLNIREYLRYGMDAIYGWQKSPFLSYGLAFQVRNNYGRLSVLPAIVYNHTFNEKWGVESIFPAQVLLRHNVSEKTLLYAGYDGESVRYNIAVRNPAFAGLESLQLRRLDVRGQVRWEQEIYDFLWFGVEAGYRKNLRFRAFDRYQARSRDYLIRNRIQDAPYLSVELFIVPPRRFSKK